MACAEAVEEFDRWHLGQNQGIDSGGSSTMPTHSLTMTNLTRQEGKRSSR